MHIFDDELKKNLDGVTLLLTKCEIKQLIGYAKQLLEEKPPSDHYHLCDENYQKEITICLYEPEKMDSFHPAIQKLIKESGSCTDASINCFEHGETD
ncbi:MULTISPECIES: hypothetical protein [Parachlamydia]|jgi:hypothetical protein|uniref:hypothetical protein n=1 Tax=Parachlamydia TaxID=83551 RepID=UPI0024E24B4E|nr:hypothetical protein [Parachlamydia acanthamoebae]